MVLTIENICQYLLEHQLIDKKDIIEGDLLIRDASSRNTNFLVNQFHENGIKILIKQPDISDKDYIESMEIEAGIYQLISHENKCEYIRDYLPKFQHYDSQNYILIMEQITGVCRVFDYVFHGLNLLDEHISWHLSTALSALHNVQIQENSFDTIQKSFPWFLNIGQKSYHKRIKKTHPSVYHSLSEILENKQWMGIISKTQRIWQEESLVHLDCRFTNWMISFRHQPSQNDPLWLIDWEMAGKGDAAWDITLLISEWLNAGLFFKENHTENFPDIEQIIIQQINKFWKDYSEKRQINHLQKGLFLKRICQYLPIRILMMSYEILVEYEQETEMTVLLNDLFKKLIGKPVLVQKTYFYD
jgi:thiamine kinase-like enzyme